ncbi:alpha/beta fold hydrolase [Marivirga tractuosa]|uniref:Alpha/beta hydrolase fold protein n=1 Tax=Marivirga tractuosa (strain ATCC 23168 / DSM 4126 / NBRC 15989 / NCIMB 1408 / VKM B-1430 / H-43) TaxID=643867 RepID=E4TQS5_MARTH|nr:alpha/beta hydrolase [Marivirga tractuosa]ADR20636.1 alpha/beta hydrolase fold protein [Marivirga tractuosa DSM 4126]
MKKTTLNAIVYPNKNSKEWIVFIHGAGGSTATWKYQVEAFKPYYNLLLIDLRDHGMSKNMEPEIGNYNFDIITEDIKAVVDQYQIDKAHFITLSFGSVIMQDLSIKYPALVASAIFAGGIFKANAWIKAFVQLARFFNLILPYKWMYSIFSYLLMPYKEHQNSRRIYRKQAEKLSPEEYMKWVGLYKEFFKLLDRFYNQKINFPAMVVMGKADYIFLKSAQRFSEKHSRVLFKRIFEAGHICNIDQPEIFNNLALNFTLENKYFQAVDLPTSQAQKSNAG